MNNKRKELVESMKRVSLLSGIPESELDQIAANSRIHKLPKNTVIIHQGDESSLLYILLSGKVRVYVDDDEGHQLIINNLGAGDYFGELALLSDERRSANVITNENCTLVSVHKDNFLHCLEKDPAICKAIMLNLVNRIQHLTGDLSSIALQDVYSRLVRFLIENAKEEKNMLVTGRLTHQEIADSIGASREMVSRLIGDLRAGGYIRNQGKQIVIEKDLPHAW